jgi:hypothetical protein
LGRAMGIFHGLEQSPNDRLWASICRHHIHGSHQPLRAIDPQNAFSSSTRVGVSGERHVCGEETAIALPNARNLAQLQETTAGRAVESSHREKPDGMKLVSDILATWGSILTGSTVN